MLKCCFIHIDNVKVIIGTYIIDQDLVVFYLLSVIHVFNTYAAGTVYIRFEAKFRPLNSTQIAEMFCGSSLVNLIITF